MNVNSDTTLQNHINIYRLEFERCTFITEITRLNVQLHVLHIHINFNFLTPPHSPFLQFRLIHVLVLAMVNSYNSTDQLNNSAYRLLCPNTFIFCTNLIYSYYIMGQNLNLYQLLKYNPGKYIIYNCKSNIKQNG